MTELRSWRPRLRSARFWSKLASVLGILTGSLVLAGWIFDIPSLKSVLPGLASMKVNTATAFILTGLALWLRNDPRQEKRGNLLAQGCAVLVILIGGLTMIEYLLGWDLGIDHLLLRNTDPGVGTLFPGRMSEATAFCLVVLGLALWFLGSPKRELVSQALAILVAGLALLILTGYVYGVETLYQVFAFSSVALHTALTFLVLSIGILLAQSDRGMIAVMTATRPGGMMARRLLPAAILLPLIIGWLRLQGQKHGLYATEFGLALVALSNVVVFSALIWWNAYLLNKGDAERQQIAAALQRSEKRFRAIIEHSAEGISLIASDGSFLYESPMLNRILGFSVEERRGQTFLGIVHPDDQNQTSASFRQAVERPDASVPILARLQHKNGSWLWLEGSFTNMVSEPAVGAIVANYREVTQHVEAEESLRTSEERFRTVVESAPSGILMVGSDGQILQVNEQTERQFGYSRGELAGENIEMLIPERFRQMHVAYREGYVSNPSSRPMGIGRDLAGHRKDGSEFPVEIGLSYTKTDKGLMTLAFVTDITRRKEADDALEKERTLLRLLINQIPDYIYVKDVQSRFILSNKAHLNLMGLDSLDQAVGKTDLDFFPHDLAVQYFADEQNVIQSGQPVMDHEESSVTHTGEPRWVVTTQLPLRDAQEQIIGLVGITRDITERKRGEQQIIDALARESTARAEAEASNRKLAYLLEASTLLSTSANYVSRLEKLAYLTVPQIADWCAVEMLESDGRLHQVAMAHVDKSKIELSFEMRRRFPPNPSHDRGIYQVLHSGKSQLYPEIPNSILIAMTQGEDHLRMVGEIGMKSAMIVPLIAHDNVLGTITLGISRSERRFGPDDLALAEDLARRAAMQIENAQLYDEARRLNVELEKRVVERTTQLETSNKELDAFSYSISHDLRAPLRAITGFSNILFNEYAETLPAEAKRYLQRINENTQRMGHLIDALLALARLGRQALRKLPTDPGKMVRQVLEELNVAQEYPDTTVVIGELPTCQADPALLKQVFINLIANAVKFSAKREKPHIDIDSLQVEGEMAYFVRDNGVGFDMRYANKLFGVFQRLHGIQEYPGTGVGLAIAHRIIKRHGGRIWAQAEVDHGATFFFTLGGGDD